MTVDEYNDGEKDLDLLKDSLAKKLKGNFEKNKLQNMQMPNTNDKQGENRFFGFVNNLIVLLLFNICLCKIRY